MANRSDRNSVLPRVLKKMIALQCSDKTRARELRKFFIDAHATEKAYVKKYLTSKTNVDFANSEEAEAVATDAEPIQS